MHYVSAANLLEVIVDEYVARRRALFSLFQKDVGFYGVRFP
jgi:hypothetical protein